jgi:hypothetical protein
MLFPVFILVYCCRLLKLQQAYYIARESIMIDMNRRCRYCETILSGRADKQFCTDHCRSAFHNKLKHPLNFLIRQLNKQLLKNRSLLAACYRKKLVRVSRNWLSQKGFSFQHITHIIQDQQGAFYHCCYDHAYIDHGIDIVVTQIGGKRQSY